MNIKQLSDLQKKEIFEVLEAFGLSTKESEAYLTILQMKEVTLTPLSKILKIPVTTVQSIVKRLSDKRLLSVSTRKTRHVYSALNPKVISEILDRQLKESLNILPFLEKLSLDVPLENRARIYYDDQMRDIFVEALSCKSKMIYEIVAAKDIQDIMGERLHFSRQRVAKNIRLKSLRVETREIKMYSKKKHTSELREARFLPRELTFVSSMLFWDNTVAIFSTKEEGVAFVFESRSLKVMYQQLFELLWDLGRPMITEKDLT